MGFRDIMLITHAHVGPAPPNKLHFRELFYAQEIDLPSMREELEHAGPRRAFEPDALPPLPYKRPNVQV